MADRLDPGATREQRYDALRGIIDIARLHPDFLPPADSKQTHAQLVYYRRLEWPACVVCRLIANQPMLLELLPGYLVFLDLCSDCRPIADDVLAGWTQTG